MAYKFPQIRATVPEPTERNHFATFAEPTLTLVREITEHFDEQIGEAIFDHQIEDHDKE